MKKNLILVNGLFVLGLVCISACDSNNTQSSQQSQRGATPSNQSLQKSDQPSSAAPKVCSIVPAAKNAFGQDFTGNYNIKIGDEVINGNQSAYASALDAGKDIAQLQKDGVCAMASLPCSVVPAGKNAFGQDFTGNYNIKIGDEVINGNQSAYASVLDAGKDIAQLQEDNVCASKSSDEHQSLACWEITKSGCQSIGESTGAPLTHLIMTASSKNSPQFEASLVISSPSSSTLTMKATDLVSQKSASQAYEIKDPAVPVGTDLAGDASLLSGEVDLTGSDGDSYKFICTGLRASDGNNSSTATPVGCPSQPSQ
jgi:hypothetical protein